MERPSAAQATATSWCSISPGVCATGWFYCTICRRNCGGACRGAHYLRNACEMVFSTAFPSSLAWMLSLEFHSLDSQRAFINLSYVLFWPFATSDENRKRWDFLRASLGCCRSIFTPSIHGNLHKSATCTIFAICKNDKNRKWWVLIFAVYPSKCIALWPPQKIFACPAVTKTLSKRWIGPQKGRIVDNGHSLWGCGNWVASRDEIWWHFLHDAETLLSMQTLKVRTINVRSMIERQFSNVSLSRRDHGHLRWWNSERVQSAQKPMTNNRYPCSWPLMLEAMRCCSHLLLLVFIHSSHCRHVSNKMSGVLFAYQSVCSLIWDFLLSH